MRQRLPRSHAHPFAFEKRLVGEDKEGLVEKAGRGR